LWIPGITILPLSFTRRPVSALPTAMTSYCYVPLSSTFVTAPPQDRLPSSFPYSTVLDHSFHTQPPPSMAPPSPRTVEAAETLISILRK
jgi:hypothetical protein